MVGGDGFKESHSVAKDARTATVLPRMPGQPQCCQALPTMFPSEHLYYIFMDSILNLGDRLNFYL